MAEFLLYKLIRLNGYIINEKIFNQFFLSHSDYPSLAAIESTFNNFQIENIISQFENEYFNDLPEVFISSLKTQSSDFILVVKIGSEVRITNKNNKSIKLDIQSFLKQWTGIVVAVEKNDKIDFNDKSLPPENSLKLYPLLLVVPIFGYILWKYNIPEIIYTIISLTGFYYCLEIYKKLHGKKSIINNICKSQKKLESSCQEIIQSDKTNFFGLKLSDIALFYFITTIIFSLFIEGTQFLIIIFSILTFPIIVYSLYIQIFKEKKLCKICLILILILLIQSGISLFYFNYYFSLDVLLVSFIYFISVFPIYIYFNKLENINNKLENENTINLRFKRNYDIFKRELFSTKKMFFEHTNIFSIGNKDAKINIILISDLECNFCADAHKILKKLYSKGNSNISFQLRFNFHNDSMSKKNENIFKILLMSYNTSEKCFLDVLDFWYDKGNYDSFIQKFNLNEAHDLNSIFAIKKENLSNYLNFTPAFLLNGYIFPQKYEREDILYFIQDLLDDEDI